MELDDLHQYGTALNTMWSLDAARTVAAVNRIDIAKTRYTEEESIKIDHYNALYSATQLWRNPVNSVIGEIIDNGSEEYVRKIQLGDLVLELAQYGDTDDDGNFVSFTLWIDNPSTSLSEEDQTLHGHMGIAARVSEREVENSSTPSLSESADTLKKLAAYCESYN